MGNGKIQYPKGEVYYGEIVNFKKHGKGYLFFSDGSKYVGEFSDGLINGQGTYYVDNNPISKGVWMNGQLMQAFDTQHIDGKSFKELNDLGETAEIIAKQVRDKSM